MLAVVEDFSRECLARVEVSFDNGIRFFEEMYFDVPKYRGMYKFNRHFMGPDEVPTSTDKFYPGFVALMEDGRLLVVEYKGKQLSPDQSRDSREQELIGQQWAKASEGKAVFVMATMERGDPKEMRTQVMDA